MQAPLVENMAWNDRFSDWNEAWKADGQSVSTRGWFEHPSDAEGTPQSFGTYASWQPSHDSSNVFGGCGQQQMMYGASEHDHSSQGAIWGAAGLLANHSGAVGVGGMMSNGTTHYGQAGASWGSAGRDHPPLFGSHDHHHMSEGQAQLYGTSATAGSQMSGYSMTNGLSTNGHTGNGQVGGNLRGGDQQLHGGGGLMNGLHGKADDRFEERPRPALKGDDSDSEEDKLPAEATQEEREEAEQVVRTAFKEAKERRKLREKVKGASPADLQALLNARFAKRS
mmetsp:Transcript_43968/g.113605  ORF Transcript_43968/g.113605 Transcript_43968/m.113605 type:complete len:281 (+) Transcript_43968:88-930(+)|eukprot:CAMPEP_0195068432 /NCGR_PEP_ID=MMETSP0448-20130528/13160_1 /TAXON_ID=66468 /ORGANISM="Heterocapsa triquestra, Strain CCMP 448" /LENGTH=280 /DNA_ID=CAMNT_0040099961 /DNA_START=89 /DNA_END=931 /DNA_ORIENTATION=-